MPVVQVTARERLEVDHVYVIPPDRRLQMVDHEISAFAFDEPRGHRAPIDLFFRSLAEQLGEGFAVILSGAGSDGALGARAVKESGGIILVQDPNEAEYASMPRSAIATGALILSCRCAIWRSSCSISFTANRASWPPNNFEEDQLRSILATLQGRTGHDFAKYKRSTVLRRIARRMQVTRSAESQGLLQTQCARMPKSRKRCCAIFSSR